MFCKNCGKQIDGNKKFCSSCGASIDNAKSEPEVSNYKTKTKKNYKDNIAKFVKISLGVLVVGGFLVFKIYNSLDSDVIDTNNQALKNYNAGDSQQAIAQFQEASQGAITDSTKINTLKNLAYVYSSEGQNDLALNSFRDALKIATPESFDYYLISGEIKLLEKKPNAALADYNTAYKMNPEDFQINNALALFYIDMDEISPQSSDYTKALMYAQKAYDIDKSETAKQNLAIANYFNNNFDETISLLSSSDLSKNPYAAYWLGLAYVKKEDMDNAKIYLKKAMDGGAEVPQEVKDFVNSNG